MNPTREVTAQVLQRVTRIESRLAKIALHLGADIRPGVEKCALGEPVSEEPVIDVEKLDVSLSEVHGFMRIKGIKSAMLRHEGKVIGYLSTEGVTT